MGEKFKQTKGNKYAHDAEFADEVLARNVKHEAQQNPKEGAARK